MSADVKQVKVDNWGTYFLQRLKHFFNRTDYCDLTLQFQDNAQLKVHRLVLSACTEYFELLERTCEMYEDRLVMPDDLQADVIVPIVNFMYTGHLEFQMDILERLYQTSQTLNMPVLTKLLESHRIMNVAPKRYYKPSDVNKSQNTKLSTSSTSNKRSYSKAFTSVDYFSKDKKVYRPVNKPEPASNSSTYSTRGLSDKFVSVKKSIPTDPRPTRYELPEELDADNIFDSSFTNISYTSKPLVVHPETVKRYSSNKSGFNDSSNSQKIERLSTLDIVECKKISKESSIFQDSMFESSNLSDDQDGSVQYSNFADEVRDSNQLFDKMLDQDDGPKVTLETKDSSLAANIDHAKIISEVLKKYPHLVKGNKNIKLKILDTPKTKRVVKPCLDTKPIKLKLEKSEPTDSTDYTYESDVLDSKAAAKLIAMGADNVKGPWICLICGTPGKALNFTSYYQFRRHLVEVHNEKAVANMCEYCGLKALKRNYLHHHLYTHHGITPPPQYNFPKCGKCNYIALTEGYLVKHKLSHKDYGGFHCNVCAVPFSTSGQLLKHIQVTGHKYTAEKKKRNLQCVYCLKVFLREPNLYAHLTTNHKKVAKRDGIIDNSDDEKSPEDSNVCYELQEPSTSYKTVESQYQDQDESDTNFNIVTRTQPKLAVPTYKQKILNAGFGSSNSNQVLIKSAGKQTVRNEYLEDGMSLNDNTNEEIVMIDNNEYVMQGSQLIPRNPSNKVSEEEFILPILDASIQPSTSMEYASIHHNTSGDQQPMIIKKTTHLGQPIQIVVSNEEEYKALMSSNHPIIFDDGDSSKPLAVLSAPHDTTLQPSTIDLNDTQPNNMMIIQDNYPINVTETVADNSNIVVVYSHPVDQNNKQFQIITTQGIGSQFAQSSAIITQNYETVTTSTPVMTDHPLDTQVEHKWPNTLSNAANRLVQIPTKPQIPTIVEEMAVVQKTSHGTLNELSVNDATQHNTIPKLGQNQGKESYKTNLNITLNANQVVEETSIIQSDGNDISTESNVETETTLKEEPTQENIVLEKVISDNTSTENIENPVDITKNIRYEELREKDIVFANDIEADNPKSYEMEQSEIEHSKNEVNENHTINEIKQSEKDNKSVNQTECEGHIERSSLEYSVPAEDQKLIQGLEQSRSDSNPIETPQEYHETIEETEDMDEALSAQEYNETVNQRTHITDVEKLEDATETSQSPESSPNKTQLSTDTAPAETMNKEVVKEIENLTSEWSEDEYDVAENDLDPSESIPKQAENMQNTDLCEVEESIENIQQEVEKQMAESVKQSSEVALENNVQEMNSQVKCAEKVIESNKEIENEPQQKISSLLNDWEDNDSQEDVSTNDSQDESTTNENGLTSVENINNPKPDETLAKEPNPKIDNIQKLVSDWDDEDEEVSKES